MFPVLRPKWCGEWRKNGVCVYGQGSQSFATPCLGTLLHVRNKTVTTPKKCWRYQLLASCLCAHPNLPGKSLGMSLDPSTQTASMQHA